MSDTGRAPPLWRQLLAILVLPTTVTVLVPATLTLSGWSWDTRWSVPFPILPRIFGVAALVFGLTLVSQTVRLFARVGRGTLAPWDPTRRLVVLGPYARTRNPMISGVALVLLGEALLIGSLPVLAWAALFVAVNQIYFVASEEPGLRKRFGAEYEEYARNVPRWWPRARPWVPKSRDPDPAEDAEPGSR